MKKARKVLALMLAFVMTVTLSVAGTIAYLTDTDNADNTFTIGNVAIELIEKQRDGEGGLKDFEESKLLPLVGSAQGEKETVEGYEIPTAANYVDKIVTVENTGSEDAWVRVIMALPAAMDAEDASEMMLHWNISDTPVVYNWDITKGDEGVKIDGVEYNLYTFVHKDVLESGKVTESAALMGVYIDSRVDATVDENGGITYILGDAEATFAAGTGPIIKVFAQAVQAAGFETASDAFTTAGMPTNPWAVIE